MAEQRKKVRTAFVGSGDDSLRSLLEDVLDVEFVGPGDQPALVFAIVGPRDPFRVLASAQLAADFQAPIIAILPIADERLARSALVAGARVCWPVDGSLEELRAAFLRAIPAATPPQK